MKKINIIDKIKVLWKKFLLWKIDTKLDQLDMDMYSTTTTFNEYVETQKSLEKRREKIKKMFL